MPGRNFNSGQQKKSDSWQTLACLFFLILNLTLIGCQASGDAPAGVEISWQIDPETPSVDTATIHITLRDSSESLIEDAQVRLEGNMSHPGMQPVLSTAEEVEPGRYLAQFEFTMAGDWYIIVHATLPDSTVVKQQIDIPGVRSQ